MPLQRNERRAGVVVYFMVMSRESRVTCSLCRGSRVVPCPTCHGARRIKEQIPGVSSTAAPSWSPFDEGVRSCPTCGGHGGGPCPRCRGTGYEEELAFLPRPRPLPAPGHYPSAGSINISNMLIGAMLKHALEELPNAAIGVLGGVGNRAFTVYPLANIEHSPTRYAADLVGHYQAYKDMTGNGQILWGVYYTNISSPGYPAPMDIKLATPGYVYCIISLQDLAKPTFRAFRIMEGGKVSEYVIEKS